jgi:hypothetical protein
MECDLISMEASICSIGGNVGWECKRRGCGVGEEAQEEGVFRLGHRRANIKGKLGKRLTQNLESHHSL